MIHSLTRPPRNRVQVSNTQIATDQKFVVEIYECNDNTYGEFNLRFARVNSDKAIQTANDSETAVYEIIELDFHPSHLPEYLDRIAEDEDDCMILCEGVTDRAIMNRALANESWLLTAVHVPGDAVYLLGQPGRYTQFLFGINPYEWDSYKDGKMEGFKVVATTKNYHIPNRSAYKDDITEE